jgi:hypothetical protein
VEVAVTLGGLRPKFASDLHHRLHAEAIHFNGIHPVSRVMQRLEIILAPHVLMPLAEDVERVAQHLIVFDLRFQPLRPALFNLKRFAVFQVFAQSIHHFVEHAISFALGHFIRTNLINEIVDDVAHLQGVQHSEAKIDRELQSRFA